MGVSSRPSRRSIAAAAALLLLHVAHGAPCSSDAECSLNGACVGGKCECVSFWGGPDCGTVQFGRASAALGGALVDPRNTSRWCAGAVHDNATSTWHLYSALMAEHCGLNAWQRNSVITHATSRAPTGPFVEDATPVMGWFAHNPKPILAPDGTWLIFHIGCGGSTSTPTQCSNGTTPRPPATAPAPAPAPSSTASCDGYSTNVLYASSPDGPWLNASTVFVPTHPNASYPFPMSADNPSPLFLADGSLLVMFRSYNGKGPFRSAIGMARAPHWRGPYTIDPAPLFPEAMEDPYLWWQPETRSYHALFHTMGGCSGVGCHAFSADARSWRVGATPAFDFDVEFDDGRTVTMKRRERPQLVFDPATGRPTHLISAVQPPQADGGQDDHTFSIAVPLRVAPA